MQEFQLGVYSLDAPQAYPKDTEMTLEISIYTKYRNSCRLCGLLYALQHSVNGKYGSFGKYPTMIGAIRLFGKVCTVLKLTS